MLMRMKLTTTALALSLIVPGLALAQQSGTMNPPAVGTGGAGTGPSTNPTVGGTTPSTTDNMMGETGTRTQGANTAAGDTGTMTNTSPATGTAATGTTTATTATDNPLYGLRGEELVGKTVYGANGEEIGEIDNVVLRNEGGSKQVAAVVGVGGFLGIGERKVALPLDQLQMGGEDRITTSMTKEQLSSMQAHEENGWTRLDPTGTIRDWVNRP
jgi:sporulation protein YlmC with PRC-barrel domain